MPMKSPLATVLAVSLLSGCASKTMLITIPEGAKVYVNEEYYGESPAEYSDRRVIGSRNEVRFELNGYQTKVVYFHKDEKMNLVAAIGAVAVLVPILWVMDYKAEHRYELEPLAEVIRYIEEYNEAARLVHLGDSKEKALGILEPTQTGIDVRGKREPERFIDENGVRVEIYYFRSRIRPDAPISDGDFTPYLFNDGRLVAIGWSSLGEGIRKRSQGLQRRE